MGNNKISDAAAANDDVTTSNLGDPLLDEAIWLVASNNTASVSLLIDRLKIGGERAAELLKFMQAALIVAPTGPGGSTQVLCGLYDTTVRPLVEAAWRGVLNVTAAFSTSDQAEVAARVNAVWSKFDEAVRELSEKLDGEHRRALLLIFERERERQFQEYKANHAAFRQKIGATPMPSETPQTQPDRHSSSRQSVGEMVARTAVRATVWETIRAVLRL